jgi:tetratricopeptide (TPR) repeat protein
VRDRALLALLVALGAGLRLWALDFGLPSWLHPDEYSAVFFPLHFFSGDLNPHFFTYPTLHYYLLGLVYGGAFVLQKLAGAGLPLDQFVALHYFWDRSELMYLARLQSALFGAGAIVWTWLLAGRVWGQRAAWPAAALLAVSGLHLRQSHLAGVDAELCFWFAGAVWAAARLAEREEGRAYALAGALVGLAAATKYPGALAGVAVFVAHLAAGRSLLDRRLWAAGGMAVGCFALASPYVLLDWSTFSQHFRSQVDHLETGHGQDLGLGWWYHLSISLPAGLGWLGLSLGAAGAGLALRERRPALLALLAALLVFYGTIGAGRAVFARYALPLLPLLAALAGGVLARIAQDRYLALAALLVCAQPLHASWRTLQLLSTPDTRVKARAWIEANVPEGTTIANFGGWAGDVKVRTFEELWRELSHFERVFGRAKADQALSFLGTLPPGPPFYSYAIQRTNIQAAPGSMAEIERLEPAYLVLHRHPLPYSRVDSAFAAQLDPVAQPERRFVPPGLSREVSQYDPLDAFYLPLRGFGALEQPGPEVEVWRMREQPDPGGQRLDVRQVFARAYVAGAAAALARPEIAGALAQRALDLDPGGAEALFALAFLLQQEGRLEEGRALYEKCLVRRPGNAAACHNLAVLCQQSGQVDQAEGFLLEALRWAPWKGSAYQALARFYQEQRRPEAALRVYQQQVARYPQRSAAHEALGGFWEGAGQPDLAAQTYRQGLERVASGSLYLRLASLYLAQGRPQPAAEVCEGWLQSEPGRADAHRLLAYACRSLGQVGKAREHAREMLRLAPGMDRELEKWLAGQ